MHALQGMQARGGGMHEAHAGTRAACMKPCMKGMQHACRHEGGGMHAGHAATRGHTQAMHKSITSLHLGACFSPLVAPLHAWTTLHAGGIITTLILGGGGGGGAMCTSSGVQ